MTPDRLDELTGAINVAKLQDADCVSLTMDTWEFIELAELALDGMQARNDKMEVIMNRDYFARPIQDSRSAYDYGKSGPIEPMTPSSKINWNTVGIILGGFVLALVMFAFMGYD